ncbi:MAG: transaldolase, partial [Chloroflexota bacterium]|nr:transaldolase [Chloroflexota bacterium]
MANSIQQTRDLGQSIWYDNVSRGLIASGAMAALVDAGITGLTSNPTIFEKAISSGDDYDEQLLALALAGAD